MKNLDFVVPAGNHFNLSGELFLIDSKPVAEISAIGPMIKSLMRAINALVYLAFDPELMLNKSRQWKQIRDLVSFKLNKDHLQAIRVNPRQVSLITRVDFMVEENGMLKIAEIDPMNKHGLGFAHLCRVEAGAGPRDRLLPTLSKHILGHERLGVIIASRDMFFLREQEYFASKLGEYSGKRVVAIIEQRKEEILEMVRDPKCCFLDCPAVEDEELNFALLSLFASQPKRFLVPPKHWMANKALMAFLHEPWMRDMLTAFMPRQEITLLASYVPPTFLSRPKGDYIAKTIVSSGAKGVFFGNHTPRHNLIYQARVPQKYFMLGNRQQYIRLAAHYVDVRLGELTVTATKEIPVHGSSEAIHHHVGLRKE